MGVFDENLVNLKFKAEILLNNYINIIFYNNF